MPTRKMPPLAAPVNRHDLLAPSGPGIRLRDAWQIPVEIIDPNPKQSRRHFDQQALAELTASVEQHGILQPILVRRAGERYEIVAGERRYRAARAAGLETLPALVRDDLSDEDAVLVMALENLQRENLSYADEARQYTRLLETLNCSRNELARRLGIDHNRIARLVRLLSQAPLLLDEVDAGRLTFRAAFDAVRGSTTENTTPSHGETDDGLPTVAITGPKTPRAPAGSGRWGDIARVYSVLNKIHLGSIPPEECAQLSRQLEDLETRVALTRRALQAHIDTLATAEAR